MRMGTYKPTHHVCRTRLIFSREEAEQLAQGRRMEDLKLSVEGNVREGVLIRFSPDGQLTIRRPNPSQNWEAAIPASSIEGKEDRVSTRNVVAKIADGVARIDPDQMTSFLPDAPREPTWRESLARAREIKAQLHANAIAEGRPTHRKGDPRPPGLPPGKPHREKPVGPQDAEVRTGTEHERSAAGAHPATHIMQVGTGGLSLEALPKDLSVLATVSVDDETLAQIRLAMTTLNELVRRAGPQVRLMVEDNQIRAQKVVMQFDEI